MDRDKRQIGNVCVICLTSEHEMFSKGREFQSLPQFGYL
jgi:hypothetical protein